MNYDEILSPGKKIKKIRKELGLKQHEITGGEVTRNLISIIENDKATLTEKVAKVIVSNINRACDERNIDFHVSIKYLLENEELQAEKAVDKFLEKLSVDNLQVVDEIEEFLIIYDIGEKKRIIYEAIGDTYYEIRDYYKSYTYYIKAYENIEKDKNKYIIGELILKLSNCCKASNRYKDALELYKLFLREDSNIDIETKFRLLLDKAEILMAIKEYDSALDEIESIEEFSEELEGEYLFHLNMLKGLCFMKSKYYRDALEIYRNLKENLDLDNVSNRLYINTKIIEIYILLRDNRNIRKYIDECLESISSNRKLYNEEKGSEIFYGIAKGYKFIKENDVALEYYNHCIYAAKRNKQINILLKALENIFEIYEEENNIDEVDNIKNELLELISTKSINKENTLIFKVISFYNCINDREGIDGIISFILNSN